MGIYLNPGIASFQMALDSDIYVDKSGLIECTNRVVGTQNRYLCVSRPRRFGKSMALDMLAAYYCRTCDSREQFRGLSIAETATFERHLNSYDVIKLVMSDFLVVAEGDVGRLIARIETRLQRELAAAYPDAAAYEDDALFDTLAQTYAASGVPFVILIDEWDCVMRELQGDDASQKRYLGWLRGLLKDREYVGLAYVTGILPVKKYGVHSALNMFTEASVLDARVAELVERAHEDNASVLKYNDENSLACVLSIAYYSARRDYVIEREAPAGKGYADLVFRPRPGRPVPALVVELKRGGGPEEAVGQIRRRRYIGALDGHAEVLLVGISYNPDVKSDDYKLHECVIERL